MKYIQKNSLFLAFTVIFFFSAAVLILSEDLIHIVGKGDTIYSISRFYSVNAEELMKVNNILDPSKLKVGEKLIIPVSSSSELPALGPAVTLTDYKVVKGDTLFGIAKKHNITLANLLEINKFTANHIIKAGDLIKVPANNNLQTADAKNTSKDTSKEVLKETISGIYALQWPVTPKEINYMTGQMGVVVEGQVNESVKNMILGNVISAGPWRKFGRVVIVETQDGYFYMYGGCDSLSVNVGDKVYPGTEVGKLGINTVSEKPQLFFMVFKGDVPIDPALAPRTAGSGRT